MTKQEALVLADYLETQSAELLSTSAKQADRSKDSRDPLVIKLLQRCAEIGRGCADLGHIGNATCLAILIRPLLENLILVLWVIISEKNAIDFKESGKTELARVMRINFDRGTASLIKRDTGEDYTLEARKRFKALPQRKSVHARAEEAGVLDLYNIFYRSFSLTTHGQEFGDTDAQILDWNLSVVYLHGIGALLKAVEHAGNLWLQKRQRLSNCDLRKILGIT